MPTDATRSNNSTSTNNPEAQPAPTSGRRTPDRPNIASRIAITTRDGFALRAEEQAPLTPVGSVVLCHPHPLHGGNMFASVIDSLFRSLTSKGFACLRFNFRGVTGSDGRHDYGQGELLDIEAAIDRLVATAPGVPLSLLGWSFGADVALGVCHPAVDQWFCIAPPLTVLDQGNMCASSDPRPVHIAVPQHDQLSSPANTKSITASWANTTVSVIPETDHFLGGQVDFIDNLVQNILPTI